MTSTTQKFCSECIHYDAFYCAMRCQRPTGKMNIVTGRPVTLDKLCKFERSFWGGCGKSGKYWVKKGRAHLNAPGNE